MPQGLALWRFTLVEYFDFMVNDSLVGCLQYVVKQKKSFDKEPSRMELADQLKWTERGLVSDEDLKRFFLWHDLFCDYEDLFESRLSVPIFLEGAIIPSNIVMGCVTNQQLFSTIVDYSPNTNAIVFRPGLRRKRRAMKLEDFVGLMEPDCYNGFYVVS